MKKLIILFALLCSCSQWVPQEQQDISNYRYDVPSEEKENAD
ncbi:MAG TPA: hypothetical protein VKZ84_07365 [Bacteriovoracaceae bacterium]|nr:hypothetical protein [Bacteriovoracaceae bacterium]